MRKFTLLLFFLSVTCGVWAQIKVQGKVTDAQGLPLPGVSVSEKGSGKGTATNAYGIFSMEVSNAKAVIKFFMLGYQTQEIAVPSTNELNVKLEETSTSLSEVVVVGSRSLRRSATETAVPVDVIDMKNVIKQTGKLELNRLLEYAAPSFNANKQTGSDGADHIDPATIRGLGPDQTLVLINGKRRHQSSLINLFGTRGRGNTGTDLNAIPVASIERVEVLRDGASAQYGSDAIAGVVNIVLKNKVNEFSGFVNTGAYDAPGYADKSFDGQSLQFAGNYGAQIGEKGFVNFSMNFLNNEKTTRVPDASGTARRQFGDASARDFGTFVNASLPVSKQTEVYAFGGFSNRFTDAYAWSRFAGANNNVDAIYPNGFDPHIQSLIDDKSLSAGLRTKWNGWDVDFNNTFGTNRMHYFVDGTNNASLGIKSPTFFDAGGFQFSQNTTGLNFTKAYDGVASGLNVAFGTEYRVDRYEIFAGEEGSYKDYTAGDNIPGGSQGFPGFQPRNELNVSRSNMAAYTDVELDVTKQYLVAAAVRYENYSDFGGTLNGKLAMRYKFSDAFNLRGSLSTGFRAPSLQQVYFNTIFTNFVLGQATEVLLSNNLSNVTRTLGIERLKQERSVNQSLGFTWKPLNNLNITVDAYQVNIKDRIVLTGSFFDNDPDIGADLQDLGVKQAQFFTNAIDTRNRGLDVILTHDAPLGNGRLVTSLAANFNKLSVLDVKTNDKLAGKEDVYFSKREQFFVEASAPKSKINLNFDYSNKKFNTSLRIVRFSDVTLGDWDGNPMHYDAKFTTDLAFGYKLSKSLSLNFGADNLFDIYPTKQDQQLTEAGGAWDSVQMNYNGRRYFARLGFTF
ncbi:MAG: TonB-dependent receptor [Sphingobacteriaceae bacterium]